MAPKAGPARPSGTAVGLSTASVYPESCARAFDLAARLGYDGVEVMVWTDPVSQSAVALRQLSDHYGVPVLALHAPCLLVTQRVWGGEPWGKLLRAREVAEEVGAATVVVHPPFRWQREYARGFVQGMADLQTTTEVKFSAENMFPWRAGRREMPAYAPSWDVAEDDYAFFTLDLSHTATSASDAEAMAKRMGDRLVHLHLADGTDSAKDEHLVPGRGGQPCAEVLGDLAERDFRGTVIVEVNTRRCSIEEREADLAESLAFARRHLAPPQKGRTA